MWAGTDLNRRRPKPPDLQSGAIDHSATDPLNFPLSRCPDLNRRPTPYHGVALPAELQRRVKKQIEKIKLFS